MEARVAGTAAGCRPEESVVKIGAGKLVPSILLLAFVARLLRAAYAQDVVYPDQVFQYLEQAHRLAFGFGFVPWEFSYGTRSWIIPGFIALILRSLAGIGMDRPDVYQPVVKILFCLISVSLPISVYRIAQSLLNESAARLALLMAALSWELVYFAPSPLADALATYSMFAALAELFAAGTHRRSTLAFGALCGLTFALRFQLAPMIVVAFVIAAYRWRRGALPALASFLLIVLLAGALDAYTWGRWFSSIVTNLEMNVRYGIADGFGSDAIYFYVLIPSSLVLVLLAALGLSLSWRATWPLTAIGLAELAALSIVGHKEPRFIFALFPAYLIGAAALTTAFGDRLRALLPSVTARAPVLLSLFILAVAALSGERWVAFSQAADVRRVYLELAKDPSVQGVIDDSGVRWLFTGGYYDLHRDVAIYRSDLPATNTAAIRASPQNFASHWILPAEAPAPAGYSLLSRINEVAVWRRNIDPPTTLIPAGYSVHISIESSGSSAVDAPPPFVSPRW